MNTLTIISNRYFDKAEQAYREADFVEVLRNPDYWMTVECDDIMAPLSFFFEQLPSGGRIYLNYISQDHDVTPGDLASIERLRNMQGNFYLVVYPQASVITIIAVVIAVTVVVMALVFKPKIPTPALRNSQLGSTNNELSERTNEARPNQRIPDIFGQLRATPDLVCVCYTHYIDNQEVEDSVLCIGRGQYTIHDARDGETTIYEIEGTSLQIYKPHTRINHDTPYFKIGKDIPQDAMFVVRSNSVNGHELKPSNAGGLTCDENVRFEYPNIVRGYNGLKFNKYFRAGDNVQISRAQEISQIEREALIIPYSDNSFLIPYESDAQVGNYSSANAIQLSQAYFTDGRNRVYNLSGLFEIVGATKRTIAAQEYCVVELATPSQVNKTWARITSTTCPGGAYLEHTLYYAATTMNFNGKYKISNVGEDWFSLENPSAINGSWELLRDLSDQQTSLLSPLLAKDNVHWIGPFIMENPRRTHIACNYAAQNGMYKDNGRSQWGAYVEIQTEVTPLDDNNNPTGPPAYYNIGISGTSYEKDQKGVTLYIQTQTKGRISVRARRITPEDRGFEGSVVDQVRWKDLYGLAALDTDNFGDVTMVRLRQWATTGALALKERRLNCLVTRDIPRRISGSNFTPELYPSRSAADILCFCALDPFIGGRSKAEIDFDNIYDTASEVVEYFGTAQAAEFAYTIDATDMNFEETAQMIADAIFCTAYRRGNKLQLFFEKKTDRSSLLFNHRNKLPGTETRSFVTGWQNDNDGIEYQYISPIDDGLMTIYLPTNRSARNVKRYETAGIRSRAQAWLHAMRLYNRLRYQYLATEFTGTQEAFLLLVGDRILVADNTQPSTQNGEVMAQKGLTLTLSQAVEFQAGLEYYCFLQLTDGTIDAIKVNKGSGPKEVILSRAPRLPLVTENEMYARTTYLISNSSSASVEAFVVGEVEYKDNFTAQVTAVNYDDRYYANDKDYINNRIPPEK